MAGFAIIILPVLLWITTVLVIITIRALLGCIIGAGFKIISLMKKNTEKRKRFKDISKILLKISGLQIIPGIVIGAFLFVNSYDFQYSLHQKRAERLHIEMVVSNHTSQIVDHFFYKNEEYISTSGQHFYSLGVDTSDFKIGKLAGFTYKINNGFFGEFGEIYEVDCGYDIPMLIYYDAYQKKEKNFSCGYFIKISDFDRAMQILPKTEHWYLYDADDPQKFSEILPILRKNHECDIFPHSVFAFE